MTQPKGKVKLLPEDWEKIVILNTFGKEFRRSLRVVNISLYYAGQLLIALSLLYLR